MTKAILVYSPRRRARAFTDWGARCVSPRARRRGRAGGDFGSRVRARAGAGIRIRVRRSAAAPAGRVLGPRGGVLRRGHAVGRGEMRGRRAEGLARAGRLGDGDFLAKTCASIDDDRVGRAGDRLSAKKLRTSCCGAREKAIRSIVSSSIRPCGARAAGGPDVRGRGRLARGDGRAGRRCHRGVRGRRTPPARRTARARSTSTVTNYSFGSKAAKEERTPPWRRRWYGRRRRTRRRACGALCARCCW